jgi:type IV pilus assembly protein PilM
MPERWISIRHNLKGVKLDLKKILGLKFGDLVGLDIGSSSVKLVQLTRNENGYEVLAAGVVPIDTAGEKTPQAVELRTIRAITECCRAAAIQNNNAVGSVCGPDVAVRYFKFPTIPSDEVASAISLEAEQVCPFSIDDSVIDYEIIPDSSDTVRGVMVAATNKVVRQKEKLLKDASLTPVLMDVDGLALFNCLNETEDFASDQAIAILNIGHTFSTLVISGDNCVPFVRDTNHAGQSITGELLHSTGLSRKQVLDILFNDGGDVEQQQLVEENLGAACEVLLEDITGTLRFYSAQKKTLFIEKIYVCGGFSQARGFVELLSSRLPAEAILWNPFEKMPCRGDSQCESILQKNGPSLAVAGGLAMRSI